MALDPAYLDYPKRHHGMDHDHYRWSNLFERPPVTWPNGKRVALWILVNLEWFPITPEDKPFRAPGHMQTAYPDYRHYTAREYGTRVGFYRLLDAFAKVGARVSVAVNAAIAERYPSIIADIVAGGHEIVAHSTDMNATIASGIDEAVERDLILRSLDTLEKVSGTRPRGWHSIARSQSFNTPRLLVEAGLDYMCDWVNDELPYRFATEAGEIVNLPLNHELSDRQILVNQQHSVDGYAEQMRDAYALLDSEANRFGGRMLPLNLTPYIIGLPYRIDIFEVLLTDLAARSGTWVARGDEIVDAARPALG
ncbi:peptidoglycan/xylan/chitin deacetylase (PgdA/CDA1 family) [Sphingomonas zeicaulis]|uniref:polysaccharide deacetylase family protein n=1 Tax=Sphingomonas zeicaulis TaxID=1632740 RepID=UPI003D1A00D9